uniref:PDZ domain-containing protein n=1 Tax=Leptobrachium leishanense TaxID=445787 RepID=A0A8C5R5D2_9ANUR
MAAEVNMRSCQSPIESEPRGTSKANKSPRKAKPSSRRCGATEDGGLEDTKAVTKTSVLQGKIKALKEKHKECKAVECNGEERDAVEDALVNPQLRTYLTEDAFESSSPMRSPDTGQETLSSVDPWGNCRTDGTGNQTFNGNLSMAISDLNPKTAEIKPRIWPEPPPRTSFHLDVSPCTNNLSLAERVERNRQELRSRFNQVTTYTAETFHGDGNHHTDTSKEGSPRMFHSDMDGDSGGSLPSSENYRELSVRHEQAKQLLHRARMKAKGASPLRASHCVISQPHSQPPLRRSPGISCTTTDGGSLSDSSSSDYCSGQRGSRGGSPSHVRFQDESERDAEERYRERQQQSPQALSVNTTPPVKQHSNGNVSWTQHLLPSEQCGTSSSYQNGSGVGQIPGGTVQGSSSRNIQLGSRITQEAPLGYTSGTRPSPHWILPSQPWRIHSELIRETHIGGDSTPDSSGEDEGNRSQSKSSLSCAIRPNVKNKPPNTFPKPGSNANYSNLEDDTGGIVYGAYKKHYPPPLKPNPKNKNPENNVETQTVPKTCPLDNAMKYMIHPIPQNSNTKATVRSGNAGLELRRDLKPDIGTGDILVNLETTAGRKRLMPENINAQPVPVVPHSKRTIPPLDVDSVESNFSFPGRVPMPPAGRAPTTVPSRANRFTTRPEKTLTQLSLSNSQVSSVQNEEIRKNTLPKSTQNNQEAAEDHQMFSQTGTKAKEHRTKERPHRSRKVTENEMPNNVKDHRGPGRTHVPSEQVERERSHLIKRHSDREHPHPIRDQGVLKEHENRSMSNSSRQHLTNDRHIATGEERHTERRGTQRQQRYINCTNKGDDMCQSISQENSTQDKHRLQEPENERGKNAPMMPQSPVQPSMKKSDIRSGMKKIFSTFGLTARPRMDRFQSSSLEQISHNRDTVTDGDSDSFNGALKPSVIKKSPSLQSLKLMSPFHLPRKASSVQNLLGKSDRSAVYVTGDNNTAPRRALSVEDIGSPDMPRSLGRVSQVYPDGTRHLELQRPSQGNFGFTISSGNGRPDSGVYVQEMNDASTAKLYSGLLRVGDEILELNGTKVSILGQAQLNEMMTSAPVLSLRVLHQRRTKC